MDALLCIAGYLIASTFLILSLDSIALGTGMSARCSVSFTVRYVNAHVNVTDSHKPLITRRILLRDGSFLHFLLLLC